MGNYWIYQHFEVDTAGNTTSLNVFDSCYVEKDTIVRGNKCYKIYMPNAYAPNHNELIRDSLNYLIGAYGGFIFSSEDFTTYFTKFIINEEILYTLNLVKWKILNL